MKTGIDYISAERERQVNEEGFTTENDMRYQDGELISAAVCYAIPEHHRVNSTISPFFRIRVLPTWPWDVKWWKPSHGDRIRELSKAGALIAAEIDRLLALKQEGE